MLRALLSYEIDKVKHSKKLIIPVIILAAFLYFNYSVKPLEVLPSFSTTSIMLFAIMVMFGVMYNDIDYSMIESAMLVSMTKKWMLYVGRILMILTMSFVATLISILYPVISSVLSGGSLFTRTLTAEDVISGMVLSCICAFSGGLFGLIANKNILNKREFVIGISLIFVIFSAAKKAIMVGTVLKIVYIIFPPIFDLGNVYSQNEYIDIVAMLPIVVWILFYIAIEAVIYITAMNKLKN